jgi:riboflavin kinase
MASEGSELICTGVVVSGRGEGRFFTTLDWVRKQFITKFGFEPSAGTFNIRIGPESEASLAALKQHRGIAIEPPNSEFCAAKCFRVRIGSIEGALVIPEIREYPPNILEIMAPVNLRAALGVRDGDRVEVRLIPSGGSVSDP